MAAATLLSRSRGAAVCWTAARGSIVVLILVPPFSSALKRALNDGRGSARSTRAIDRKGATSREAGASVPSNIASIASFSRSTSSRSGIGALHPRAEVLQRPELQLLHRALGLVQTPRDLADASLFDESLDDDAALVGGQIADEPKHIRASIGGAGVGLDHRLRRILNRDVADRPSPSISNRVGRNPQQPGGERRPAILKAVQRRERFVKDLGGHVLGGGAVVNATHDERVDPFEMLLVQRLEFRRILLGRLDLEALVSVHVAR